MSRRNTRTRASTSRKRKASDISISDETNKENQSSYEDEERKRVLKKAKVKALLEDFDNEGRKLRSNFNIDFSILIAVWYQITDVLYLAAFNTHAGLIIVLQLTLVYIKWRSNLKILQRNCANRCTSGYYNYPLVWGIFRYQNLWRNIKAI